MKILGQICTLNDENVIDRSLQALLEQTRPLDEILIVDNGSSDGTLRRCFPNKVTVIRHPENLGTSGGARTALDYGLEHGYDWVWTFDADSAPPRDGLEKLLSLYDSFSWDQRDRVRVLACLPVDVDTQGMHHGIVFTRTGYEPVSPVSGQEVYECDTTIWSGSLFRLDAVKVIGVPCADYIVDWGENEYGFRGMRKGYKAYVHQGCPMAHNIDEPGGVVGPKETVRRLGPLRYRVPDLSPFRLYYVYRNMTYFFLYEYFQGDWLRFIRFSVWMPKHLLKLVLLGRFRPEVTTCIRGFWDGLRKHMHVRY